MLFLFNFITLITTTCDRTIYGLRVDSFQLAVYYSITVVNLGTYSELHILDHAAIHEGLKGNVVVFARFTYTELLITCFKYPF